MSISFQQNWFHLDRSSNSKDISVFVTPQFFGYQAGPAGSSAGPSGWEPSQPVPNRKGGRVAFRPAAGLLRLEPVIPAHRPASRFSAGVNRLWRRSSRTSSRFARRLHVFGPNGHICFAYKRGFFPNGFLGFLSIF